MKKYLPDIICGLLLLYVIGFTAYIGVRYYQFNPAQRHQVFVELGLANA